MDKNKIAKAKAKVDWLFNYYMSTRGVGHTTVIMNGAITSKNALLLGCNFDRSRLLAKGCENITPITWLQRLEGIRSPLVLDNSAITELLIEVRDALGEIDL